MKAIAAAIVVGTLALATPALAEPTWTYADPVPKGYHVETFARGGILAAGGVTFAVPWALSIATLGAIDKAEALPLLFPGVGPFIQIAVWESLHPARGGDGLTGLAYGLLALDGVLQCLGIGFVIYGASRPSAKLVRDGALEARFQVSPVGPSGSPGLTLGANF